MTEMDKITVIKQNLDRQEVWRYSGQVLARTSESVILEAFFNRDDMPFNGVVLKRGDRFVEAYFAQRWFNIFEVYDRDDKHLKAWYCNVTRLPEITADEITYVDLALDLLVFPDGKQLVLDEDEFGALDLDEATRIQAMAAMKDLEALAEAGELSKFIQSDR